MKLFNLIVGLSLFISFPLSSQSWQSLDSIATAYYEQDSFSQASNYFRQAVQLYNEEGMNQDSTYFDLLFSLAQTYYRNQEFRNSLRTFKEAKEVANANSNIPKKYLIYVGRHIGDINKTLGLINEAISDFEEVLELSRGQWSENSAEYARDLNNLGGAYQKKHELEKALSLYEQAAKILKKEQADNSNTYLWVLNNIVSVLFERQAYAKALPRIQEVVNLAKTNENMSPLDYYILRGNLGMTYLKLGYFERAIEVFDQNADTLATITGKLNIYYLSNLQHLGATYRDMEQAEKSLVYFLAAREIALDLFGQAHHQYLSSLYAVGNNYRVLGLYDKAFEVYEELELVTKQLEEKDPIKVNNVTRFMAEIWQDLGQYKKALPLYLESVEVYRKVYGEKHSKYWVRINNLATLYHRMGEFEESEARYLQIIDLSKKAKREKTLNYATNLSNLGSLYTTQDNSIEAIKVLREACDIALEVVGETHPSYATFLNNIGLAYKEDGQIEEAIRNYEKSIQIIRTYPSEKLAFSNTLDHLAEVYFIRKRYEEAINLLDTSRQQLIEVASQRFSVLGDTEREKFFKNILQKRFDKLTKLVYENKAFLPTAAGFLYDNSLLLKGQLLKQSNHFTATIQETKDTLLIQEHQKWKTLQELLYRQYGLTNDKVQYDLDSLEQVTNSLERWLVQHSAAFEEFQSKPKWQDVQKRLQEGEVAIEFIRFNYGDSLKSNKSMIKYAALVVRPSDECPKTIELFDEELMTNLLAKKSDSFKNRINHLYQGGELYQMIWEPLDSLLQGVEKVYYSPTGLLHRISFPAITMPNKQTLGQDYDLNYASSTRNISYIGKWSSKERIRNAIIYGGIQYGVDSTKLSKKVDLKKASNAESNSRIDSLITKGPRGLNWAYLDTTLVELELLSSFFKTIPLFTMTHENYGATEKSFKAIGKAYDSPAVLHIATHGYFFPDPKQGGQNRNLGQGTAWSILRNSPNPLLRSGLILAGANKAWAKGGLLSSGENGILTAQEISNLNLSHTHLAVLSACDTGLGDIKGSEGVYGLQRAFKMAGVDYLLLTLWSIPDSHHTVEFMELFYTHLLEEGASIPAAFRRAQNLMQKRYSYPYYWASFVLVE